MPVVLVRCVTAMTLVRDVTAFSTAPNNSSELCAGTGTGSTVTVKPSRRARTFHESRLEGWLWLVKMTSSLALRSTPLTTILLPSLVLRVIATSSADTRNIRAALPRSDSCIVAYLVRFWKDGLAWKSRKKERWRSITGREAGHTFAAFR